MHIDQTFDASISCVHHYLPSEASELLKGRVRAINVWRPIGHPVAHKPLAMADWRTLEAERDLVPVRHFYADRESSAFAVRYNAAHRWFYLADQTPEEVVLLKIYDSAEDRARAVPHSAFLDASSKPDAPHRQSIEVRALVFSD